MTAFWQAQRFCRQSGAHFLSPFDDTDVIEGQASVAVEIERQLGATPDHIVLPGWRRRACLWDAELFRRILPHNLG
jgi:hypothetical protein